LKGRFISNLFVLKLGRKGMYGFRHRQKPPRLERRERSAGLACRIVQIEEQRRIELFREKRRKKKHAALASRVL
jgi:hypothetical protein